MNYILNPLTIKVVICLFLEVKEEIVKLLHMYIRDFPDKCLALPLPEDLRKLFGEI